MITRQRELYPRSSRSCSLCHSQTSSPHSRRVARLLLRKSTHTHTCYRRRYGRGQRAQCARFVIPGNYTTMQTRFDNKWKLQITLGGGAAGATVVDKCVKFLQALSYVSSASVGDVGVIDEREFLVLEFLEIIEPITTRPQNACHKCLGSRTYRVAWPSHCKRPKVFEC